MIYRKGYTLIEIVFFIAIIAIFIHLAVPSLKSITNNEYKETAKEIKSQLEFMRNLSLYEKKSTVFKAYRNYYEIIIDDIITVYELPEKTYFDYDKTKIIKFSPSGRLSNTESLYYKKGDETILITVNPVSGRVRLNYEK